MGVWDNIIGGVVIVSSTKTRKAMTDNDQVKVAELVRAALQPMEEDYLDGIYVTISKRLMDMLIENFELKSDTCTNPEQ